MKAFENRCLLRNLYAVSKLCIGRTLSESNTKRRKRYSYCHTGTPSQGKYGHLRDWDLKGVKYLYLHVVSTAAGSESKYERFLTLIARVDVSGRRTSGLSEAGRHRACHSMSRVTLAYSEVLFLEVVAFAQPQLRAPATLALYSSCEYPTH